MAEAAQGNQDRGCATQPEPFPMSPLSPEGPHGAGQSTAAGVSSPLDHILIFGHGRVQRLVLLCTTLAFFSTLVHATASTVLARPVDHWCRAPAEYSNLPPDTWKNASVPASAAHTDDGKARSQCFRHEPPFPMPEDPAADNRSVVPCDAGWEYEPGAIYGGRRRSIVNEWDLVCGRRWIISVLTAVYMAGGAAGAPLAGIAADRVGRRPVLCFSVFLLIFAGIPLAFSHTVLMFAALRFLEAAAAASTLVTSVVLLFEVTDSQCRALFCVLAVAAATLTSSVYGELVYNFVPDWQAAQIAYMLPTCALVVAVYLMDESPCWLLATHHVLRAERVLSWLARVNGVEQDDFKRRLAVLRDELQRQQEPLPRQPAGADAILSDQDVSVTDLLTNQSLRQRSAIIFGCWFLIFGGYVNLSTGEVLRTDRVARVALVVLKLPAVVAHVYILKRAGRRLSLAFGMAALSVLAGFLAVGHILHASPELAAVLTVSWLLVFHLCAITVFAFSAELYPTVVRGAAVGFCYTSGRLGAVVAPFINEIPTPGLKGAAYAVAAALLVLFALLAQTLPETTQLQPANTMRGVMADQWKLTTPLRLARSVAKRKRSKSIASQGSAAVRSSLLQKPSGREM